MKTPILAGLEDFDSLTSRQTLYCGCQETIKISGEEHANLKKELRTKQPKVVNLLILSNKVLGLYFVDRLQPAHLNNTSLFLPLSIISSSFFELFCLLLDLSSNFVASDSI